MPSASAIEVASVTALKRLEGVEFTVKSVPMERLFRHLSSGNTVAISRTPPTAPRRPRPTELEDASPGAHPPTQVVWDGASRRYALDFVENGVPRQLLGFTHGRFDLWGCAELIHSRAPRLNLSILTAVGIDTSDGARIIIPTVVSDKQLVDYLEGLKAAMRQLYIDYIGDRTHTITITCEHTIVS